MIVDTVRKQELVSTILERCADRLGDVTGLVMDRYYADYWGGREAFERHAQGSVAELEGWMVENTLYCLMTWLESPTEVKITLGTYVPHHQCTLDIPVSLFTGLIEAAADIVMETIPSGHDDEHAVWEEIRIGVVSVISSVALADA